MEEELSARALEAACSPRLCPWGWVGSPTCPRLQLQGRGGRSQVEGCVCGDQDGEMQVILPLSA